ncbi:putative asparagine synthase [Mycena vulgaris]|nr:putative asparagine synthase [Mycena vulgaris]
MCGIVAVYYCESASPPPSSGISAVLDAALKNIQHRGPDHTGTWVSSEIYDHERIRAELEGQGSIFKTKSDSELVVHLYKHHGFNLLSSLRGEFAFVLYDSNRQILFAARDRFGVKGPLYYTVADGRLLIASEMKAFLPFGWKAQWDIDSVVQNGDFSDNRTVFKGVKNISPLLMPGHYLLFRRTGYIKTQCYWDLDYTAPDTPNTSTIDEMVSTVRSHLFEAIRLRLRSDVPVGVYLSGGIDSAAIAGMAMHLLRQENPKAKLATFTLAFPDKISLLFDTTHIDFIPDAGDNNEGPIAHRTAAFIGAEENMVHVRETELVAVLEETMWHVEQPIWSFHGPGKFLLSKFVHEKGYKVVLSGEKADEFFGGYAWLPVDYLHQPDPVGIALGIELPSDVERQAILTRIQLATVPVLSLSKNSYEDAQLARKMLGRISAHRACTAAGSAGAEVYNARALEVAGLPDVPRAIAEGMDPRVREKAVSGEWHPLNVASACFLSTQCTGFIQLTHASQYVSAKTILLQAILNHMGERMEMAHSVEGRPPFLDHNIVQYINTLSPSLKVRPIKDDITATWSFTDKWILRQAVKPFVTEELFLRRKLSYNAPPLRRDKRNSTLVPLQEHLKARINQANVERVGFFKWSFVEETLDR